MNRKPQTENPKKVFIKNVPPQVTKEQLENVCSNFGSVVCCEIKKNKVEEKPGLAKVVFLSAEAAKNLIENINGIQVHGFTLQAALFKEFGVSNLSDKDIVIHDIPPEFSIEQLKSIFSTYGTLTHARIIEEKNEKRVGFVSYMEPDSARQAIEELHNFRLYSSSDKPLKIKLAKNNKEEPRRDEQNTRSNIVIAKNLPCNWNEQIIRQIFSRTGRVVNIEIVLGENSLMVLVAYATPEMAEETVNALRLIKLGEKFMDLSLYSSDSNTRNNTEATHQKRFAGTQCKFHLSGWCVRGDKCWYTHG